MSKQLRREIYREMAELSEKFPDKPEITADLSDEIDYTCRSLENIETDILQSEKSGLIKLYKHIKELLDTDRIREIRSKNDEDARFGYKTATSTFFGFKNHLAMTEERIITGIEVKEAIGDMAYVSGNNLDVCEEKGVTLYARTNSAVAAAAAMALDEGFNFNKDAGMLQCPTGELAMRVEKRDAKNGNTYLKTVNHFESE